MMFYKLAQIAVIIIGLSACKQEKQPQSTLKIETRAISDTEIKVSLADADSTLITAQLINGSTTITLPINRPRMIVVEIPNLSKPVVFFADINEMVLSINGESDPAAFTVTGSMYQDSLDVFARMQQANKNYLDMYNSAWQQAIQASDSLTMQFAYAKLDSAYYAFEDYKLAFAKRNGIIGALIAQRYLYEASYSDLNDIYENIPVLFQEDELVKDFKKRVDILKNTQVGMRFTDITQADTTGAPLSISAVSGSYVLLDFWASWCGPCRAANPDLVQIYNDFKDKGLQIVGISLDNNKDNWKRAINTDGLTWYHMSDLKGWQNEGAEAYGIRSIPQSILLDHQGFIIQKNLSTEELRNFLEDNLKD